MRAISTLPRSGDPLHAGRRDVLAWAIPEGGIAMSDRVDLLLQKALQTLEVDEREELLRGLLLGRLTTTNDARGLVANGSGALSYAAPAPAVPAAGRTPPGARSRTAQAPPRRRSGHPARPPRSS